MQAGLRSLVAVAAVLAVPVIPARAVAQYFGQNQVEYESFKFRVLKTQHFDIYYYPEEERAVQYAAQMAERAYARISRLMDHELSNRQALILYASGPHFRQTNVVSESGEGTGGVTEILKRRIVLPFAGPLKETDHVLTHELIHAFQFDMTGARGGTVRGGGPSVMRYPLWFVEGMAEYLSLGPHDPNTTMWMRDAVRADKLPNLGRLEDPRFFPYRYGQALWAYVGGRWGDDAVGRVLKASRRGDVKYAFQHALGKPADSIVALWQEATKQAFEPLKEGTQTPDIYGRPVVLATKNEGSYNIGPVLSPDGSKLTFLSSRDLFSVADGAAMSAAGRRRGRAMHAQRGGRDRRCAPIAVVLLLFVLGTAIPYGAWFVHRMAYDNATGERSQITGVQQTAQSLDTEWQSIQDSGATERQRITNIRSLTEYRDLWPQLLADINAALPKAPANYHPFHQRERAMAGLLQPVQAHDLHKIADMEGFRRAVEAEIGGDNPAGELLVKPLGIGALMKEAALHHHPQKIRFHVLHLENPCRKT